MGGTTLLPLLRHRTGVHAKASGLDPEAVYKADTGDSVDNWEAEKEVLDKLGIDTDEVQQAREEHGGLPKFMQ